MLKFATMHHSRERSHSGLVHRSRKPEWSKGHRGFESHPLRHLLSSTCGNFEVSIFPHFSYPVASGWRAKFRLSPGGLLPELRHVRSAEQFDRLTKPRRNPV